MTFTFSIPTWASIRDMFLLIIVYYGTLVAPQYDWLVFGIAYYFGILVTLRSWWRLPNQEVHSNCNLCTTCGNLYSKCSHFYGCVEKPFTRVFSVGMHYLLVVGSLVWPLIPLISASIFMVTFGNKKGQ